MQEEEDTTGKQKKKRKKKDKDGGGSKREKRRKGADKLPVDRAEAGGLEDEEGEGRSALPSRVAEDLEEEEEEDEVEPVRTAGGASDAC